MRIALFEPDIPQNTGTILRLAACLGVEAHIIEPAGFPTSDRAFRRAGMDYLDRVSLQRHTSWQAFQAWRNAEGARLILFTTRASKSYLDHSFRRDDILLFGRESSGLPEKVHEAADVRLVIPMREGLRSLNVAMAAAMAVGEAMRQLRTTPPQATGGRSRAPIVQRMSRKKLALGLDPRVGTGFPIRTCATKEA
jgi:tRNA (cytidine/uridine-2'-O-)-methyltransferase